MEKLVLTFKMERETKNTIRYQEEWGKVAYSDKDIAIGPLYIQKQALGKMPPKQITVTVEAAHGNID
jgi:hypothetical protein